MNGIQIIGTSRRMVSKELVHQDDRCQHNWHTKMNGVTELLQRDEWCKGIGTSR